MFLKLIKVLLRVLLKHSDAARATKVNPLPLAIGIDALVDLAAQDWAGGLGLTRVRRDSRDLGDQ